MSVRAALSYSVHRVNRAIPCQFPISYGSHIFVPPTFDRLVHLLLSKWGLIGSNDRKVISDHVGEADVVVDVGANQGLHALYLSLLVGDAGHVYAFEPERELFASLCANLKRNDISNVTAYDCAVGARESSGVLRISPIHSGGHALIDDGTPGFGIQPTEIRRLDDQLPDEKIAFVKIDAQGAEPEVLAGMQKTIDQNPGIRIFLEFWPWGMRQRGHSPLGFFETLQELGLCAHSAVPPYRSIADAPDFVQQFNGRRWENLLVSKPSPPPD